MDQSRTPPSPDDGQQGDLPDRIEELPAWREPPRPPEIPEVLRTPIKHPSLKPVGQAPSTMASLSEAGKAWGMALDFVATIIVGILLGWLLGKWLGSMAAFVLGGLAVGLVTAFVRIIRASQRAERREVAAREQARRGGPPR